MRRLIASAVLLLFVSALVAVACGDDGDDADPQSTPTESIVPPTVAPDAELTRYDGQKWPYIVYYPTGWEPRLDEPTQDEWYLVSPGGKDVAHLAVRCGGSLTTGTADIDDMQLDDLRLINIVESTKGTLEDAEVAGRRALKWSYIINFPGTPVRAHNFIYYVQGNPGECSYRIAVVAVGADPVDSYPALLDRIVAEFIPDRGSTEG